VGQRVAALVATGASPPGLEVVLCGDDPASATYVAGKSRASARVGIRSVVHTPPVSSTTDELVALVERLDADGAVDGILVQLPLPAHVDQDRILDAVAPEKDVDGFHPRNLGLLAEGRPGIAPCTPAGCMELLRRYDVPVRGARAVIVGRSVIVGRPMALLLLNADATVTVCHSRTRDLAAVCREADILVAAVGRAGLIDASFVKPGACVIDVGMNRVDGRLCGDVDRASVEPVAGWLTPVPRGVGPMTIAMLMRNAVDLAEARRGPR
jgi:methylenetetrahydrofolate dehydrogenase (NADP+)/methenyltetrahydrofolate cyclohydrolase